MINIFGCPSKVPTETNQFFRVFGCLASNLRTIGTVKELLEGGAMPMEVLKKHLGPQGVEGGDGLEPSWQLP